MKQPQGPQASSPQQAAAPLLSAPNSRTVSQPNMSDGPTTEINVSYLGISIKVPVPYLILLGQCPGLRSK